ncbi:MAG: response regulator transcription factor [Rhodobacteraceae bacterium]|nr:response regulator transcription factor [Paracoccaceae bacterium]
MSGAPQPRLLLVEDDTGVGRLLERGLAGEGYAVTWVRDLASAKSAENGFDLVVLDRMLPDGDGASFCTELAERGSPAAVLMLTARDALEDKLSGYTAGADDYLTKPFEFDELLARLNALARRVGHAGAVSVEAVLDEKQRSLTLSGQTVRFTKREWPLFQHLYAHAGEAQSREELIRDVWGGEGAVSENNVDVYVGYLRRKLTQANVAIRIDAVRGVGYVLER